ncbi:TPA: hypothetical protein R4335_001927 [Pasteurella multocida]|nr:hypothetical protein [Pasteurella multocida]
MLFIPIISHRANGGFLLPLSFRLLTIRMTAKTLRIGMDISAIFTSAKTTLDLLSGIETNSILSERISLLKDQIEILRNTCEATQKELTETKAKCAELEKEISRYRAAEDFVFARGAAFKKTATGYTESVFCPQCFHIASPSFERFPFECKNCGWRSSFKKTEFKRILASLP